MIKEIEVGGVKHSITLADDMVGDGLKKRENGFVDIKTATGIPQSSYLMTGIIAESGFGLCLERESIARGLSGSGLETEGGRLRVSTTGLTQDFNLIRGLAKGLAGTGLIESGGRLAVTGVDFDVNALSGVGLWSDGNKLYLYSGIAGSGFAYTPGYEPKMDVCINTYSGLGYDYTQTPSVIYVRIATRYSGLRLFFNEKGELDVTQD